MKRYLVCITGASGSIYGIHLLRALARAGDAEIHLIVSDWGRRVMAEETGLTSQSITADLARDFPRISVIEHKADDLGAQVASGSFRLDATLIVPASMATAGALASGTVANLVHRAGAVALKEGWPIVVAPRETPLSLIDLKNLELLASSGAIIMPVSPPFYNRPQTVDELVDAFVAKILDRIGVAQSLFSEWRGLDSNDCFK